MEHGQTNITFSIGDFVFAKLKGFSYWPAIIEEVLNSNKVQKYNVRFFGDSTVATIKQTELCLYSENVLKYGQPKTKNFKNKTFNEALKEAETLYAQTLKTQSLACSEQPPNTQDTSDNIMKQIKNKQDDDVYVANLEVDTDLNLRLWEMKELKNQLEYEKEKAETSLRTMEKEAEYDLTLLQNNVDTLKTEKETLELRAWQLEEQVVKLKELLFNNEQEFVNMKENLADKDKKITELETCLQLEKSFHNKQIENNILLKNETKILAREKQSMEKEMEMYSSNKLIQYHKIYPNDNFKILSQRLITDLQYCKEEINTLNILNKNLKEELKSTTHIITQNYAQEDINRLMNENKNLCNELMELKNFYNNGEVQLIKEKVTFPVTNSFALLQNFTTAIEKSSHSSSQNSAIAHPPRPKRKAEAVLPVSKRTIDHKMGGKNENVKPVVSKKVTIVSDSQGRGLANHLCGAIGHTYKVHGHTQPGAPLNKIVESMESYCFESYNKQDWVVIIGGCNDLSNLYYNKTNSSIPCLKNIIANLENQIQKLKNTNLLIATIPYRYDLHNGDQKHSLVASVNDAIRNLIYKHNNAYLLDLYLLEQFYHTRHGFHINHRGKRRVSKLIQNIILNGTTVVKCLTSGMTKPMSLPQVDHTRHSVTPSKSLVEPPSPGPTSSPWHGWPPLGTSSASPTVTPGHLQFNEILKQGRQTSESVLLCEHSNVIRVPNVSTCTSTPIAIPTTSTSLNYHRPPLTPKT